MHLHSHRSSRGSTARRAILAATIAMATVATAATTVALALTPTSASGTPGDADEGTLRTSGLCRHEAELVTDALKRSSTQVDIDGDGRLDAVGVATDESAGPRCRAFGAVDLLRGPAYSTALDRPAVAPRGAVAE